MHYRPDVDGLRAIAVIGVVVFHAFARRLPGGFVGVDIFFVISGFLISGLIFAALRRGTFSYLDFYARRIRRIFPALGVVLAATLVCGWFILLPDQFKQLGKQTAAGAGFAANILFWREAGYFDDSWDLKPLLHLWSLGVEEQFYIIWPLIVALLYRSRRRMLPLLTLIALASFALNIALTRPYPDAAFYMAFTRFWELLSGGALACMAVFHPHSMPARLMVAGDGANGLTPPTPWLAEALSVAGIVLLTLSLWKIDSHRAFPGWWATMPTAAAMLLILARRSWINRAILSNSAVVFVGLISYPLYLWHFPILTLIRVANSGLEVDQLHRLVAIAFSVLLAYLTYEFVERPIRFGRLRAVRPAILASSMAVIGALGLLVDVSDGGAYRFPEALRPLAAFQYDLQRQRYEMEYRMGHCLLSRGQGFRALSPECFGGADDSRPLIVLWGDSHAASLYPGLLERARITGSFRIAQFTKGGCPPVLGMDVPAQPDCRSFNEAVIGAIRGLRPRTVIVEGDWWFYTQPLGHGILDPNLLRATWNELRSSGAHAVIVFGDLPVWQIIQPHVSIELWKRSHQLSDRTRLFLEPDIEQVDAVVRQTALEAMVGFVSPLDLLCDLRGCLLSSDQRRPIPLAWDDAHLTDAGSSLLIRLAAAQIFQSADSAAH